MPKAGFALLPIANDGARDGMGYAYRNTHLSCSEERYGSRCFCRKSFKGLRWVIRSPIVFTIRQPPIMKLDFVKPIISVESI